MAYVLTSQLGDVHCSVEIASYEFPDHPSNELDANWVVIMFTATTLQGNWNASRAALLTWEVEDLIRWCRGAYHTEPLTQFVEPALQLFAIQIDSDRVHLQVTLSHELLPPWHDDAPLVLDLVTGERELREFADDLEDQLARYPYRYPAEKKH